MVETVKFYTDEHSANAVAEALRRRGVNVRTTYEAGLLGASDKDQLSFAKNEHRVPFTQDDDFLRLHASGESHAGIVYAKQGTPIGEIIRGLMLIYEVLDAEDMKNHIEFL